MQSYRELGRVLVALDGPEVIGHLQLIPGQLPTEAEVKSLAVRPNRQGTGVGASMVRRALEVCDEEGLSAVLVATAIADTQVLRFYQLLGFRALRVDRDVFTHAAGYPSIDVDGIELRDRLWLSIDLMARTTAVPNQVRVARHTTRLAEVVRFYRDGLGLVEVGGFRNHDSYDGVFLQVPGTATHLEFTAGGEHKAPTPHPESLLVLYLGNDEAVRKTSAGLGVEPVAPANPYWADHGVTIEDPDGFRVVLVPEH